MKLSLSEFEQEHLAPAQFRCGTLESEIAETEAELAHLFAAVPYSDVAAAESQRRLAELTDELDRWQRRRNYLQGRANAGTSGRVTL